MFILMCLFLVNQGSVNGGFQTVVRVFWGNEIPLPPFYLNFATPFLPQFYLFLTSSLPLFNLNLTSASSRFSNHGLETTVYIPLGKFHFARFTLSCLSKYERFPPSSSHTLARHPSSPGLALSSPGPRFEQSRLAVKTGKREIYYLFLA